MENGVGCVACFQALNQAPKLHALSSGGEWTGDIASLRWRPDPQYCDPVDAEQLRPCYKEIECRCAIGIAAP